VTTGDFDGDGRLDIAASNWGANSRFQGSRKPAFIAFAGDVDGNGTFDFIEAYFNSGQLLPFQPLFVMSAAIPFLDEKFPTAEAYARASLSDIYGEKLKSTTRFEVNWLESTIFLNRGARFVPRTLPLEAQISPAFALCVADFDGDGSEDLFLSQNFFANAAETSRSDAGRGLCLLGDGRGQFRPLAGNESGLKIYGEQRGAAVSDYDADGRPDLAVTQNSAGTKLYHNELCKPELRVRLIGSEGNLDAIGATIRLTDGRQSSAAREVRAGSGYLSQDSSVQLLAFRPGLTNLWVRWPGGKVTTSPIPTDAREISIRMDGSLVPTGR
jgi:hypothetical protein